MSNQITGLRKRTLETLSWLLLLSGIIAALAEPYLRILGCSLADVSASGGSDPTSVIVLAGVGFAVIGRILTNKVPGNRISWLVAALGLGLPLMLTLQLYAGCASSGMVALPGAQMAHWVTFNLSALVIIPMFILLPAWFPNGRSMSRRWDQLLVGLSVFIALLVLFHSVLPGTMHSGLTGDTGLPSPLSLPWPQLGQLGPFLRTTIPLLLSIVTVLSIISFVLRFRRSRGDTRQQFRWFATFLSTIVLVHIMGYEIIGAAIYPDIFSHWSYGLILVLSFGGFPVVIGLTVFKYRLYDLDIIIRRTLSYAILTGILAIVFFGGVVVMQSIFTGLTGRSDSPLVTVVSTLAISALFNPLRVRIQAFIDRRFYRASYNAEQALSRFASIARDEVDLDVISSSLLQTVSDTIQPEQTSIWLQE